MKIFRCALIAAFIAVWTSAAYSTLRIGVTEMNPVDISAGITLTATPSMSVVRAMMNRIKKYTSAFHKLIKADKDFEAVDMSKEKMYAKYQKYYQADPRRSASITTPEEGMRTFQEIGRSEKCRYVLMGFAKISHPAGSREITAEVEIGTVDVMTGEIISFTGSGKIPVSTLKNKKKNANIMDDAAVLKLVNDVAANTLRNMKAGLSGSAPVKVAGVEGGKIILDQGKSSGISAGNTYKVYTEARESTEDVFGSRSSNIRKVDLALIRVTEVQENSSTAEVMPNAGTARAIQVGDMLTAITPATAEKTSSAIASGILPKFPDKHPDSSSLALTMPDSSKAAALPELPAGNIRVGIIRFGSKTRNVNDTDASEATDTAMRFLSDSAKISVLEKSRIEEVERANKLNLFGMLDLKTAIQVGKLTGCNYIVMGSVVSMKEYQYTNKDYDTDSLKSSTVSDYNTFKKQSKVDQIATGLDMISDLFGKKNKTPTIEYKGMKAEIDMRIVNVDTGDVYTAFTEDGSSSQESKTANMSVLKDSALYYAAVNASSRLRAELAGEYLQVESVDGDYITLNRGRTSGINEGDFFYIYPENMTIKDSEAIICVQNVMNSKSIAEVSANLSGSFQPKAGMRLEHASDVNMLSMRVSAAIIENDNSNKNQQSIPASTNKARKSRK